MSISMSYHCPCGFRTLILDAAQNHANATGHVVSIQGALSANKPVVLKEAIEASAAEKVREMEIMRRARQKGLV